MGSASQRTNISNTALSSQKVEDDNYMNSKFSLRSTGASVTENELFPNSFPGNKVKLKSPTRMGSADGGNESITNHKRINLDTVHMDTR